MKYIGGYFALELPRGESSWHPKALALCTGRACMAAILRHRKPRRVRLPFYMCGVLLEPMRQAGVKVEFYALDERLLPIDLEPPAPDELVLAVNYFGLQSSFIRQLGSRFGRNFIADHTQAFFDRPGPGYWAFNSARKFFGVPDGAYLYPAQPMGLRPDPNADSDIRYLVNRLIGRQQTGYHQVRRKEQAIDARIRAMSPLSRRLLAAVDYEDARRRRVENYRRLHALLERENLFDADLPRGATPFCYPLVLARRVDRVALARERLYISTLWPDVITRKARGFGFEREFAARLLPLPIDHQYEPEHMEEAVRRLRKVLKATR